ncbi:Jas TPL-binding domain [Sesbania bispinosa]|nr:Jas TPL-binding domain [Sesbania bispinosa]
MERFHGEKQYNYNTRLPTNSNKIDLTLKLSPCGENAEERGLTRSSSSMAGENGKISVTNRPHWGPFVPPLERSCSLPTESGMRMLLEKQRRVAASAVKTSAHGTLKEHSNPSWHSVLEGPRDSAEGVGSNIQISTKQENDSIVSQKTIAKEIPPRSSNTKLENPAKKLKLPNYCSLKGDVMEILRQMPSVTTTGDGPNGKRIEGFLYKYRSGQVCIVCVCHGSFLTPAEFVRHAGGKEVANPMKHITVYSDSF